MSRLMEVSGAADGAATILGIGTANPSNCVLQNTFPHYYFRITNCQHHLQLKQKFTRICERSMIKKRYMHLTEEMVNQNPNMCSFTCPSLDARQHILATEVPQLAKQAAQKALAEWGPPVSKITHLVFSTTIGLDMPDNLINLLGLNPSVNCFKIYHHGCFVGATLLRLAKDLAENNAGARVLVICSELFSVAGFRGPSPTQLGNLVGQALFSDGAAAVVVGSDPLVGVERPIFEMVSAMQTRVPGCEDVISGQLREAGLLYHIGKQVPHIISENIDNILKEAFDPLGISDWNSIFWVGHPGGPAILNRVESKLGLTPQKLSTARHVLSEYGNMLGAGVLFVLDRVRKVSGEEGMGSTGEGLEWGVLFGFGPGITIETIVLRSVPIINK